VISVSWKDAVAYTDWLSQQTAKRYRLPSEAEWEYAARGGSETAYWWGNEMKSDMVNVKTNIKIAFSVMTRIMTGNAADLAGKTRVGSFNPNPFGLYDTAGNVEELVQDCWHKDYNGAPTDGSAWGQENGGDCNQRVVRGGSVCFRPEYLRSSFRAVVPSDAVHVDIGFRVVREID
jgi:formylglycine-generating enzyme required for sulfatase activity